MDRYTLDTCVTVYPFTRHVDGEEIVIGRTDTMTFLALPAEAVEILDYLAQGKTIQQVQTLYQEQYGEVPDIAEFLELLESEGFVQPKAAAVTEQQDRAEQSFVVLPSTHATPTFHFVNFPQRVAELIFKPVALIGYGLIIVLALVAAIIEPSVIPGWSAYLFTTNMTIMVLSLTALTYSTLFLHELAHLVAARAVGVPARFSIGHRLWVLVAETDMTGVWSVPRNKRYLPFLAGSLLDAVSAAVLILVFFAEQRAWISLPPVVFSLGRALLLAYLLRILWQCYFFVQTDFYYVITTLLNCKNLIGDTETYLQNIAARFIGWLPQVDQSHIPAKEMRTIRWYALVWLGGRIVALSVLLLVSLPLMYTYLLTVSSTLQAGFAANPYAFIDSLVLGSLFLVMQGTGFWLWFRSLYLRGKKTYEFAKRPAY